MRTTSHGERTGHPRKDDLTWRTNRPPGGGRPHVENNQATQWRPTSRRERTGHPRKDGPTRRTNMDRRRWRPRIQDERRPTDQAPTKAAATSDPHVSEPIKLNSSPASKWDCREHPRGMLCEAVSASVRPLVAHPPACPPPTFTLPIRPHGIMEQ